MTKIIVSEAMVEAGARALAVADGFDPETEVVSAIDRRLARACLEAALAVREGEDG